MKDLNISALPRKYKSAQTVLASMLAAFIFLAVTVVIWVVFPGVRQWVHEKLPLLYEFIPIK